MEDGLNRLLEIEYYLKPEDVLALHRFHLRTRGKKGNAWIGAVFFGQIVAIILLTLAWTGEIPPTLWPIIGLLALVVLLLLWRPFVMWNLGRNLRQPAHARVLGWRRLHITPEGVTVIEEHSTAKTKWTGIEKIGVTDEHAFLYTLPEQAHVVPRHAFASAQEFREFVETAQRYLREARLAYQEAKDAERLPRAEPDTRFARGEEID
jgi:hypothetical protein